MSCPYVNTWTVVCSVSCPYVNTWTVVCSVSCPYVNTRTVVCNIIKNCMCITGEVLPRTGHEGPEGEWRYSSTLSSTKALDGGG